MAVATLTSQLTDVLLDPGAPTALGSGNAQASETLIQLEGANCAAIGHAGGLGPTVPTAISEFRGMFSTVTAITRTNTHLHLWVRDLYPIRNKSIGGISAYIFGTSEALYYATGLDDGYGGGWFHIVINLDPTTRAAVDLGTAPSTNITRVGYCGNISASKGEAFLENCYLDAIRSGTSGQGVTFIGGTGTGGNILSFLDCANADLNSYGLLRNVGGSLVCEGPISFGSATNLMFLQDSLKTINFTNFTNGSGSPMVSSDYYKVVLNDGTTGNTDFRPTDITWNGVSRALPFSFDASSLSTGDNYISIRSTFIFASNISYGPMTSTTDDIFIECGNLNVGGGNVFATTFNNCDSITMNTVGDALSSCNINLHNTLTGIPFVTTDDLSKINSCVFDNTGRVGHAIEITTPGTYTFSGNMFTGYGLDGSTNAVIYNNSGGLVTINITNQGDTPTIRNGALASTVINNNVTISVVVQDTNGVGISGARVRLTDTSSGTVVLEGLTSAFGVAFNTSFNYTGDISISGPIRKGTTLPYYKEAKVVGNVTSSGFTTTVTMVLDS